MKNFLWRFLAPALTMLFTHATHAQQVKVRCWDKFQLELPISSLLDPGYQRLKGTLGWQLNHKTYLLASGAYGLGSQSLLSFTGKKIGQKFWESSVGIRYFYRNDLRRKRSNYLETELGFLNENFFRSNDWYYQNGQYLQFGGAVVSKASWRMGVYFGKQKELGKKLFFNWQFGLSVRANEIQHYTLEPSTIEKPLIGGFMKKFDRQEGWSVGVVPVLRIALGWKPFNRVIKIKNH